MQSPWIPLKTAIDDATNIKNIYQNRYNNNYNWVILLPFFIYIGICMFKNICKLKKIKDFLQVFLDQIRWSYDIQINKNKIK